jgi:hypothetical protein
VFTVNLVIAIAAIRIIAGVIMLKICFVVLGGIPSREVHTDPEENDYTDCREKLLINKFHVCFGLRVTNVTVHWVGMSVFSVIPLVGVAAVATLVHLYQ